MSLIRLAKKRLGKKILIQGLEQVSAVLHLEFGGSCAGARLGCHSLMCWSAAT